MDHYIPITRKYRPQKFSNVLGQEAIIQVLANSLSKDRVGYAYLFSGIRGTGKTTLARIFAKALNCHSLTPEGEPCNHCPSCLEITSGSSLDVIEIDGASNRGIDDIRQITESAAYAPSSGRYKIYIIDEVHMLTKEAFNALLKTLEEPPATVKFFFATTEPQKVPPTILSRCQRFPLKPLQSEQITQKLSQICDAYGVPVEKEALPLISHLSSGSVRDAESLLEKMLLFTDTTLSKQNIIDVLGIPSQEDFTAFDKALSENDLTFPFHLSEKLQSQGKEPKPFITGLTEHLRLSLRANLNTPKKDYYIRALDYLIEALSSQTISYIHLEVLLLKLLRLQKRLQPETLVDRLETLEKNLRTAPKVETAPAPIPNPKQEAAPLPEPAPTPKPVSSPKIEPPQPMVEAPLPFAETPMPKAEPLPVPKLEATSAQKVEPTQQAGANYDTLLRFAGVELNGSVNKEFKE